MNRLLHLTGLTVVTLLGTACSSSDNPRLAMCQTITKNVIGAVESWEEPKISEGREMVIKATYKSAAGESGEVDCRFKGDPDTKGYKTAPAKVAINGRELSTKELFKAGTSATKEQLTEVAKETKKQSKELAGQAQEKAEELAGQAQVKADELAVQAEELAGKAGEMAKKATDAALDAANETTKKVQEAIK